MKYPHAELLHTRWNAMSRIDILDSPAVRFAPGLSLLFDAKLPPQLGLSVDGGELNAVTQWNENNDPNLEFLDYLPSSFVYYLLHQPSVLAMEPKGGLDVLAAVFHNAGRIKIIESNPLIVRFLNRELSSFCGSLYQKGNIRLVQAMSRSAIKKEKEQFDLIVFSLTDIFGSSSTGIYGFQEDYRYTVDSFIDLLEKLSPEGFVSVTLYLLPPPRQELKLLATWIEALEKTGRDPAAHLAAIRSWGSISYFIKKSPFKRHETAKLRSFSQERLFDLVYYPGIKTEETNIHNKFESPIYHNFFLELLSPGNRNNFYKDYLFQIKPASDDRPFFFNIYKLGRLKETFKALGNKWPPLLQGGFLVPVILLQSIIAAFFLIFLPLLLLKRRKRRSRSPFLRVFLYFSFIGVAFMFVEITFIQKFILLLGHPLYSISTILFSLLFASGLGSLFSKKLLGSNLKKKTKTGLALCSSLIVVYFFLLPLFYEHFIGLSLPLKTILTFLAVFPLGFFMGFPFPTGIRLLDSGAKNLIPWAWATNAFSSVVGSILVVELRRNRHRYHVRVGAGASRSGSFRGHANGPQPHRCIPPHVPRAASHPRGHHARRASADDVPSHRRNG